MTTKLDQLKQEYRQGHDGDSWGNATIWLFDICATLHNGGVDIPADWEYRPAAVDLQDVSEHLEHTLSFCDTGTLLEFGQLLHRLQGMLIAAEKDY